MELPSIIYEIIGQYALKANNGKNDDAKRELARLFVVFYPEYIDVISNNYTIPFFENFNHYCKNEKNKCLLEAKNLIQKHNLNKFNDIIIENFGLSTSNLVNIAEYCFDETKNLDKACEVYCKLGYPLWDGMRGNEDYLISFIKAWIRFAVQIGLDEYQAQFKLLYNFIELDNLKLSGHYGINDSLKDYFPFTIENVNKIVDEVLYVDNFVSSDWMDLEYSHAYNRYIYLFNKVNADTPLLTFMICAHSKWLLSNISIISDYFPEISISDLKSILLDYSLDIYEDKNPIPDYESNMFPKIENDLEDLMYKLHDRTPISNYELSDIWSYFVVDRALTYFNHKTRESIGILQTASSKYPENGDIMLPWKYARYVDGKAFFYHPNHEKGEHSMLPYVLVNDKAQKGFMDLNKSIVWNFPFIACKSEKGKIVEIDEDYAKYVISHINYIYQSLLRLRSNLNIKFCSRTAEDILLQYKTTQLKFLKRKQLKRYPIIPVIEIASSCSYIKEETSLLFTINDNNDVYTLVYENTSISRASYVFIVNHDKYDNAIKFIISFFTSNRMGKRAELQYSRDMFNKDDGFLRVIRVLHDNNDNWETAINFYSKKPL